MSQSTPSKTTPEQNKALVLEAFDTLFNRRDYDAAERFWSDRYIQHSAHIAPGRDGLFNLKSPTARFLLPLRLESGAIALGETVAFLSSVIPAEAGIQRPKTRHSPLDSRLRGNDGNTATERSENPNACPAPEGRRGRKKQNSRQLSRDVSMP